MAGIIDELCPVRDVAHPTHGQVIEVLVANRLSSPTSGVRVEDWARKWAVEEVFGPAPELLNDDRPARSARRPSRSSASMSPRSTGT